MVSFAGGSIAPCYGGRRILSDEGWRSDKTTMAVRCRAAIGVKNKIARRRSWLCDRGRVRSKARTRSCHVEEQIEVDRRRGRRSHRRSAHPGHGPGTLPSSVMMAAATTPVRTSTAVHHKLSGVSRRARVATVSHKKTVKAVKHKKGKKHHKKSKKA
jgi:hypothetical protein